MTAKVWHLSRDVNVRSLLLIVLSDANKRGPLEESEVCFCSDISGKIYQDMINQIACCVKKNVEAAAVSNYRVSDMDTVGLSKVRYLGGYVTLHMFLSKVLVAMFLRTFIRNSNM